MANLVENTLMVSGPLNRYILDKLAAEGMDFFVPMPRYIKDPEFQQLSGTHSNDWGYDVWGTKWDIYEDTVRRITGGLQFTTANGSADEFTIIMAKLFPDHSFELIWYTEDDHFETRRRLFNDNGTWLIETN
jgi:hypothetical protein